MLSPRRTRLHQTGVFRPPQATDRCRWLGGHPSSQQETARVSLDEFQLKNQKTPQGRKRKNGITVGSSTLRDRFNDCFRCPHSVTPLMLPFMSGRGRSKRNGEDRRAKVQHAVFEAPRRPFPFRYHGLCPSPAYTHPSNTKNDFPCGKRRCFQIS
jgi:hypothetical protein